MSRRNYRDFNYGRPFAPSLPGSDPPGSWPPYSEEVPDSLFDEVQVLAHPHLNTTPSTCFDTASDDLLNTHLTTQRSTTVPYGPPHYPPAQQQLTHTSLAYHTHPSHQPHRQSPTRYHSGQTHGGHTYNRALPSSGLAGPRWPSPLDDPGDGNWQAHDYLPHADLQIPPTSIDLRSLRLHSLHSPSPSLSQYQSSASSAYQAGHSPVSPFRGAVPSVAEAHTHYQRSATMRHASLDRTTSSSRGRTVTAHLPYTRAPTAPLPVPYNLPEPTVSKKKGKRLDACQLEVLNRTYADTPYPSKEMRHQLARDLDMSARSVQIWFQNRRSKSRGGQHPANSSISQVAPTPPLSTPPVVHPRGSVTPVSPMGESPTRSRSLLLDMMRSGQIPSPLTSSGRPRSRRHQLGPSRGF